MTFSVLPFVMLDIVVLRKKSPDFLCLSLPGLGWKYFSSLRTEEDEPIYTYNAKYMRWFIRQSIKGGRVCAFNQYFKSKHCNDILKIRKKISC